MRGVLIGQGGVGSIAGKGRGGAEVLFKNWQDNGDKGHREKKSKREKRSAGACLVWEISKKKTEEDEQHVGSNTGGRRKENNKRLVCPSSIGNTNTHGRENDVKEKEKENQPL